LTFDKLIKKGIMTVFFDKHIKCPEDEFYSKYSLSYFVESMVGDEYPDEEVMDFINFMKHRLESTKN
jgi:hypothetical protein